MMVEENNSPIEKQPKSSRAKTVYAILVLAISFLALLVALWPFNPLNKNLKARAEAGNTDAQMKLAEYYYSVDDKKESDYWYRIASEKGGTHRATALNNVAAIELTCEYYSGSFFDYCEEAINMFIEAVFGGNSVAVQNLHTFLKECQSADVPVIDYDERLSWVIRVADYYGIPLDNLDAEERASALKGFNLDRSTGIIDIEGRSVYTGAGFFPDEDVFSKNNNQYTSYRYSASNSRELDYSSQKEQTVIHVPGGVVTGITESGGEIVIPTYRSEEYGK